MYVPTTSNHLALEFAVGGGYWPMSYKLSAELAVDERGVIMEKQVESIRSQTVEVDGKRRTLNARRPRSSSALL